MFVQKDVILMHEIIPYSDDGIVGIFENEDDANKYIQIRTKKFPYSKFRVEDVTLYVKK